jgi:hypothetical protein
MMDSKIDFVNMAKYVRTLTVLYDTEISYKEIPLFRGAVLKSIGDKANVLYHNHTGEETFRYSYPLIQYKRLNGKAAITCVEEGVDLVGQLLSDFYGMINLGQREAECKVMQVLSSKDLIQLSDMPKVYHLHQWLPLNAKNYEQYQNTDDFIDKIKILERVLIGNLLSFLKGVDIYLEEQIDLHITNITGQRPTTYKRIKLMAFDIEFKTNLCLPNYIGIGKNASIGYGILTKNTK